MNIPFTADQFYGIFTAYNTSVWPMQFPLLALGMLAVVFLKRQRSNSSVGISAILTALWVWQALAYHLAFFTVINPLAYAFAAVFMAGAAVFFWQGVIRRNLIFKSVSGGRAWAGWGLLIFAFLIYPAWTYLMGHRYPAFPTFGLPCPTTLFTIGLLAFLVKPYPRSVFVVPVAWCFVGSQAAYAFDVQADLGLIAAGILGLLLLVKSSGTPLNRILFFGAGVLGSLYAARLKQSGLEVTLLARNKRLQDIKDHGIVLEHALTGKREVVAVPVIEHLYENDAYELIVVLVRKNQLASVLPILASHKATPNILFMVNNPSGYADWANAVGRERVVLGFAGAGGTLVGHVVRYVVVSRLLQPTTFGEPDGFSSARLKQIVRAFSSAGFPTAMTSEMDAWQKTHVAWVSPLANALYRVNCDNHALALSPDVVRLMVRAVREGFSVLRSLGIPIIPARMRMWEWIPESLLVRCLMFWADTHHFRTIAVEHTVAATDEMHQIAADFKTLAMSASVATPAMDELRSFIPSPPG